MIIPYMKETYFVICGGTTNEVLFRLYYIGIPTWTIKSRVFKQGGFRLIIK